MGQIEQGYAHRVRVVIRELTAKRRVQGFLSVSEARFLRLALAAVS
jgi:hypothetical protein